MGLLGVVLTLFVAWCAPATAGSPLPIHAQHAYVFDADTGRVYYQKGGAVADPASITKLASSIIIARDYPDLGATTTVEADDLTGGSTAGLQAGNIVSLRDLIAGALLPSGNDATFAMARKWGRDFGTGEPISGFVKEMNALAASLGMTSTTFTNPSGQWIGGIPKSSARDVGVLLRHALQYPVLVETMGRYSQDIRVGGGVARRRSCWSTPIAW